MSTAKYSVLEVGADSVSSSSGLNDDKTARTNSMERLWKHRVSLIIYLLSAMTMSALIAIVLGFRPGKNLSSASLLDVSPLGFLVSNIAFGSCTSYDLRKLDIWKTAIIPSAPDAWIWTGDMVYLDDNEINCNMFEDTQQWQEACNCTATWLEKPPYRCKAGDVDYANNRWIQWLHNG
jgi:hypothetical protein